MIYGITGGGYTGGNTGEYAKITRARAKSEDRAGVDIPRITLIYSPRTICLRTRYSDRTVLHVMQMQIDIIHHAYCTIISPIQTRPPQTPDRHRRPRILPLSSPALPLAHHSLLSLRIYLYEVFHSGRWAHHPGPRPDLARRPCVLLGLCARSYSGQWTPPTTRPISYSCPLALAYIRPAAVQPSSAGFSCSRAAFVLLPAHHQPHPHHRSFILSIPSPPALGLCVARLHFRFLSSSLLSLFFSVLLLLLLLLSSVSLPRSLGSVMLLLLDLLL